MNAYTIRVVAITAIVGIIIGSGLTALYAKSVGQKAPESSAMMSGDTSMGGMHAQASDPMLEELKSKSGSDRDEAFLESMIVHHQSAIDMSELILESTKRPELKQLATEIITAQTQEIEMMKGWLSTWYGR